MFRKKAYIASQTSLKDWEYMKIILSKAIENYKISDAEMDEKCQKALYEVATRSVITPSRINNDIGISNILDKQLNELDRIVFDEQALDKINSVQEMANQS